MEVFVFLPGLIIFIFLFCYFIKKCHETRKYCYKKVGISFELQSRSQSDQNNIYNISGSVQGQNQHAYPDAYLSIDHIAITNELNKPPPKYDDAPPSYEEALKLAMAHSNSLQTYQSEQGHSADLPRTHLPAGSSID
ncbi:uncharacterized protein LOC126742867 isoform X7 [Anthonomus grandis grandis]|uniref:uncharacterized protein LOC126742867 isoform X7 n=1 Tax=Anthonomus grandis grandis TaxID=2921223 RepID=UPI00216595AB|nr:uncharacterized protein LOC126742867 isoform X7 [Anthonomus grandis grandis]